MGRGSQLLNAMTASGYRDQGQYEDSQLARLSAACWMEWFCSDIAGRIVPVGI